LQLAVGSSSRQLKLFYRPAICQLLLPTKIPLLTRDSSDKSFMPRILNFPAFASGAVALLSAMWIVVPAPHPSIWLFSVAASEWSLWIAALALFAIVCALTARYCGGGGKVWILSLMFGIVALIISTYPLASVISIAREKNVSLSVKRYFSAVFPNEVQPENFKTYTFAQIDGVDLQLDVYAPTVESGNNGASVIVVHGGSWSGGRRDDFPQWNQWLAANGYTVFDIDYRLTQPNYLTATGDVKCAVRWVKNHAAEFKIAPERIALLGRSAGAHLALLAAYSADDSRIPASCNENQSSETVRAVVSFYAPIDLLWAFDNPANERVIDGKMTLSNFLGDSPHKSNEMREKYVLASPLSHISADTPPTLLIHGGQDQLVRSVNMTFLADKLTSAKVPHQTLLIPYAQHGFDYNFNGFGAQVVQPEILNFLRDNTKMKP
jgi:acetyl esterase/lipase